MSIARHRTAPATLLAGALCVLTALPAVGAPIAAQPSAAQPSTAQTDTLAKVDHQVLDHTAGTASTQFLVKLKDAGSLDEAALDAAEQKATEQKATGDGARAGRIARTGEVMRQKVKHADATQKSIRAVLTARHAPFTPFWITNVIEVSGNRDLVTDLAARSDVASIRPNALIPMDEPTATGTPAPDDDTVPADLTQIGVDKVRAQYGVRGEGVVVASIDSGVQFDHPALVRQYRGSNPDGSFSHDYNWFDPTGRCSTACDNGGHGTHTMGTMVGDDGVGGDFGVAPGAKWIAAKHVSDNASVIESGQWMVAPTDLKGENPRPDMSPDIVNNSWGNTDDLDPMYEDVLTAWVAAGIFPVFSIGNSGDRCASGGYPGVSPQAYAVGATYNDGTIAEFSSRGNPDSDTIRPDISAPGVKIRSSLPGGTYGAESGTSMAAPHVAGAVALLWSAVPNLRRDVATTRKLLASTARDRGDDLTCGGTVKNNNTYGEGTLDTYALIRKAQSTARGGVSVSVTRTGKPLAGAEVRLTSGAIVRSARTDAAGKVQLGLVPAGTYTLSATAFGLRPVSKTVSIGATGQIKAALNLTTTAPGRRVFGLVTDPDGRAVAGAKVSIADEPGHEFSTDTHGRFTATLPEGDYDLVVEYGRWLATKIVPLTVNGTETLKVTLARKSDTHGYVASSGTSGWDPSGTQLRLTGDEATTSVSLPFPMSFYGSNYRTAVVHTNGYLTFGSKAGAGNGKNTALPASAVRAPAVFAFWDDLVLDSQSTVRTRSSGRAPARTYTITWTKAKLKSAPGSRVDFQLTLSEAGKITLQHHSSGSGAQRGASATVGIQGTPGHTGRSGGSIAYSTNQPHLSTAASTTFHTAGAGLIRGTVTDANDHQPIGGATVLLHSPSAPERAPISALTDSKGFYQEEVPAAAVQAIASAGAYLDQPATATVRETAVTVNDVALRTALLTTSPTVTVKATAGTRTTVAVPLNNTGTAPASWEAREINSPTPPTGTPGRVLSSFRLRDLASGSGLGLRNDEIYAADGFFNGRIQKLDLKGTSLTIDRVAMDGLHPSDLAYLPARDLFCASSVTLSEDPRLMTCFDPKSFEVKTTITLPMNEWGYTGIAYRAQDDTFYVGGSRQILHLAGLSSPEPGKVLDECTVSTHNVHGLALNEKTNVLWAMGADVKTGDENILALDPQTCAVGGSLEDPDPERNSTAGLDIAADGSLWVMGYDTDRQPTYNSNVFHVEAGTTGYSDVPWLSVANSTGELAAGAKAELGLTVDTTGLEPGTYTGTVLLVSNGAKAPQVPFTVSVTVS